MAQAQVKVSERQAEILDDRYLGKAPPHKSIDTSTKLIETYNWYSARKTYEDAKEYLIAYAKEYAPEKIPAIKQLDERMNRTMGWIADLAQNNMISNPQIVVKLARYIESLNYVKPVRVAKNDNVSLRDRLDNYIPDFELAIDQIDPDFKPYGYLQARSVPQSYAAKIAEYYTPLAEELVIALKKSDPQITEGYHHMKKAEIVTLLAYVMLIIEDCQKFIGNQKKDRKPRKAKTKKPEQKLKHFTYMVKNDELKLASINPEQIFGASQLFVLNTSNNVLTIYNAKEGGLSVSRTSIANYDEKTTKSKRVGKKMQIVLDTVMIGNKKARSSALDLVASEFITVSDRINTSCILLKVVK